MACSLPNAGWPFIHIGPQGPRAPVPVPWQAAEAEQRPGGQLICRLPEFESAEQWIMQRLGAACLSYTLCCTTPHSRQCQWSGHGIHLFCQLLEGRHKAGRESKVKGSERVGFGLFLGTYMYKYKVPE
jgi:hypothetical protein